MKHFANYIADTYGPNTFFCLSILCLSLVSSCSPCCTNNNESNEAKSRSDATCARSRREISAACRKMQDEISLPAAFLGRKIPLGKLRSLLPSRTREKIRPPFLFPYPFYRISRIRGIVSNICFLVLHYPVHSNKCISRKLHA